MGSAVSLSSPSGTVSDRSSLFVGQSPNSVDTNGKIPTGPNGDQHFPPASERAGQKPKTHVLKCSVRSGPGPSAHEHGACLTQQANVISYFLPTCTGHKAHCFAYWRKHKTFLSPNERKIRSLWVSSCNESHVSEIKDIFFFPHGAKHFIRSQMQCFLLDSRASLIAHSKVRYILFSKSGRLWKATSFFLK